MAKFFGGNSDHFLLRLHQKNNMLFLTGLTFFTLFPIQWAYPCGIPAKCKCYQDLRWVICAQKHLTTIPLFTFEEYQWISTIDVTDNLLEDFKSLNDVSNLIRHWEIYARGNLLDCFTIGNYSQLLMDYPCENGSREITVSPHIEATIIISGLRPNLTLTAENNHSMNYLALGLALFALFVLAIAAVARGAAIKSEREVKRIMMEFSEDLKKPLTSKHYNQTRRHVCTVSGCLREVSRLDTHLRNFHKFQRGEARYQSALNHHKSLSLLNYYSFL